MPIPSPSSPRSPLDSFRREQHSLPESVTSLNNPDSIPEMPTPSLAKSAGGRTFRPLYIFFHCATPIEVERCCDDEEIFCTMLQKTPTYFGGFNSEQVGDTLKFNHSQGTFDFGTARYMEVEALKGDKDQERWVSFEAKLKGNTYSFTASVSALADKASNSGQTTWRNVMEKPKGKHDLNIELILTISNEDIDFAKASYYRKQASPAAASPGSPDSGHFSRKGSSGFNLNGSVTLQVECLIGARTDKRYCAEVNKQQYKTFRTNSVRVATAMCGSDGKFNPPLVGTSDACESTKDRDFLKVMVYEEARGRASASKLKFNAYELRKKTEERVGDNQMTTSQCTLENGLVIRISHWSGSSQDPPIQGRPSSNSNLSTGSSGHLIGVPILPTHEHLQTGERVAPSNSPSSPYF